jgi:dihydrofolate reductase
VIISLIAAVDEQGGIGKKKHLPWHLPSDLHRFKNLTMGHHITMGRVTYETIGKTLAGRIMIVITRQKKYQALGCLIVNSLETAIELANNNGESELFIIGGGMIFKQTINLADRIYLTRVHTIAQTDTFFPYIDHDQWEIVSQEKNIKKEADEFSSEFELLQRKH